MKDLDHIESILDLIEKKLQLSRRDFSKAAVPILFRPFVEFSRFFRSKWLR